MTTLIATWRSPRRRRPCSGRQALAADPDRVAVLGARLDLDVLLAGQRLDRQGRAEHRGRRGHLEHADEVGALAMEALVRRRSATWT